MGVRKGSIIGVYLDTTNPLPVIGMVDGSGLISACVITGSVTDTNVTCNASSRVNNRLVQVEATISKYVMSYNYTSTEI